MAPSRHASVDLWLDYRPVGQGLFTSGLLRVRGNKHEDWFAWVFDCGSWPRVRTLSDQIDIYAQELALSGVDKLAFAVISHFDADHLNGMVELMRKVKVHRLFLPYLPLHERLIIALEEGIALSEPLFRVFRDPHSYFRDLGDAAPTEIIFVMPSGREGPSLAEGDDDPDGGGDFDVKIEKVEDKTIGEDNDPLLKNQKGVKFMHPGGRITISSIWEFVPYNDGEMLPKASPRFLSAATVCAKSFLTAPNEKQQQLELDKLRIIYDGAFGAGSYQRNVVSLSLYSGPIKMPVAYNQYITDCPLSFSGFRKLQTPRCGQLYTGDAYFETPDRFDSLRSYLGQTRLDRYSILQVMHHGAEGNWHPGLAQKLGPVVSVFSSDPAHKKLGHPHSAVLRDFWTSGAVQVDKVHRFSVRAHLAW